MKYTTTLTTKFSFILSLVLMATTIYDMIVGNINTITVFAAFFAGTNIMFFFAEKLGGAGAHNHTKDHVVGKKK